MTKKAELHYDGKVYELPVITGSENENAIDISRLRADTGLITLDKGFKNTGSTSSKITYLDGEKGILRHRGYSIEELASKSTFTEVCYLLIYGELPNKTEIDNFENKIRVHTLVHEDFKIILEGYPSKAHPMGILSSLITSLTAFYPESLDPNRSKDLVDLSIERILGKIFFNQCVIVDRQLRYSQNNSIHQTKIMMDLVTKNGLDLNDQAEIKNIFDLNKINLSSKKLCLIHLSSKWVNKYFSEHKFINLFNDHLAPDLLNQLNKPVYLIWGEKDPWESVKEAQNKMKSQINNLLRKISKKLIIKRIKQEYKIRTRT